MIIDYMAMLKEFHEKYGHHIESTPVAAVNDKTKKLRLKLMWEELDEVEDALEYRNLELLADGLADLLYVVFGTAVSYGIPINEIFAEVHRSNMTKSIKKNEYGKTIKGENWEPPNIKRILEK